MRRFNSLITAFIIALVLIHVIYGSLVLFGASPGGNRIMEVLTIVMFVLVVLHIVIGLKLTADTIKAVRRSGVSYPKENRLFWTRRISGFALLVFLILHVHILSGRHEGGVYRLSYFGILQLLVSLLFVISLLIHLITNIRPLKIALGLSDRRNIKGDILFFVSIILLLAGIAFFIYYLKWQAT